MAIKVVSYFGSASLGDIVAEQGMITQEGTVVRTSGSLCLVGSGSTQSEHWQYDHFLQIASGQAYQQFSWPTGINCNQYSRDNIWANGIVFNEHSTSGHTYLPHGVGRPTTFPR